MAVVAASLGLASTIKAGEAFLGSDDDSPPQQGHVFRKARAEDSQDSVLNNLNYRLQEASDPYSWTFLGQMIGEEGVLGSMGESVTGSMEAAASAMEDASIVGQLERFLSALLLQVSSFVN